MAQMKLNDQIVEIDIVSELEEFEWKCATWKPDKLIACSPFRDDHSPSFYVRFEDGEKVSAGFWQDSAGIDGYEKGDFITLLSFLREETPEDVIEYLLEKYGSNNGSTFQFKKLKVEQQGTRKPTLPHSLIEGLEPHNYLVNRGVSPGIQKALKIGFDPDKNAVALPWFLPNGELANVKYRRIDSKRFFYAKGGWSIGKLLFNIQLFHQKDYLDLAVITEAEIDSLSCIAAGFPSLAVGGSKWSKEKKELILGTNIKKIIIASDNDAAGENLKSAITESLNGYVQIFHVTFPDDCKDCNDVLLKYGKEGLRRMIEQSKAVPQFKLRRN
ncbi:toprim domain-containing protein [Thermoactinomyces daqus]|uniref:Toprim domain-containing protein n=1 Tax=Thermoactinomyces daqus TaxID=1329516 RepID=A0A7W1XAA3_9BACL|nr:toprim domain-containing protein [Thermoactinomyces daqus]MBA4542874.1 toprim domain-containing protein [Thermoactinomyces daqus]